MLEQDCCYIPRQAGDLTERSSIDLLEWNLFLDATFEAWKLEMDDTLRNTGKGRDLESGFPATHLHWLSLGTDFGPLIL